MKKGYCKSGMGRIALGTHLGDFSKEDSKKYQEAISYALQHGITTIDGAINYRGMCSEKDEGAAIGTLMEKGNLRREDFCITSKAGLLYGDVQAGKNPGKYLEEVLEPQGITRADFSEYGGLYQTLNPKFFEIALQKSLQNLDLETIDVHYIHIPEISRLQLTQEEFYDRMEMLFAWYEDKVKQGKIRYYGIALEFMAEEPQEEKWHFELEKVKEKAQKAGNGMSHFKYVLFEYNRFCAYPVTTLSQTVKGQKYTLAEACRKLELETVGSMPFAMGDALKTYRVEELLAFALEGVDHVIVGSRNIGHIKEILEIQKRIEAQNAYIF